MPTYTVYTTAGALKDEDKQRVAGDITRMHNEVTGAQRFFVQVIFVDMPAINWFVGGARVAPNAVFLHGQIRSGRTAEMKQALLIAMAGVVQTSVGIPKTSVWVYIIEIPSVHMLEYGHVLPEPGGEAQWLAGLPIEDRALMEATGAG